MTVSLNCPSPNWFRESTLNSYVVSGSRLYTVKRVVFWGFTIKVCQLLPIPLMMVLNLQDTVNSPGPEIIQFFTCSTQLSTKFILLINVKMPTIVGILTFISMIKTSEKLKARTFFICQYFSFYKQLKFHTQLSYLRAWITVTCSNFHSLVCFIFTTPCMSHIYNPLSHIYNPLSHIYNPLVCFIFKSLVCGIFTILVSLVLTIHCVSHIYNPLYVSYLQSLICLIFTIPCMSLIYNPLYVSYLQSLICLIFIIP